MQIASIAASFPEREVDNKEVLDLFRTRSESVFDGDLEGTLAQIAFYIEYSGARTRRWLSPGENFFVHTDRAIRQALDKASITKDEIDLLIYASVDRRVVEPGQAHFVAKAMGMDRAECFDVLDACNSWSRALFIADKMLKSGFYHRVMIVTNEFANHEGLWVHNGFSLKDQASMEWAFACGTLGEAATATVLTRHHDKTWAFNFMSDTRHADLCMCPVDDWNEAEGKMNEASVAGQGGRKFATFAKKMHPHFCSGLKAIAEAHPFDLAEADVVFPHSHAQRIWLDLAKELKKEIPFFFVYPTHGNLVSGSVPGAMALAESRGELRRGDRVTAWMCAAGLSFSMYTFEY